MVEIAPSSPKIPHKRHLSDGRKAPSLYLEMKCPKCGVSEFLDVYGGVASCKKDKKFLVPVADEFGNTATRFEE